MRHSLLYGRYTPHLLSEALGWHNRYLRCGQMKSQPEIGWLARAISVPIPNLEIRRVVVGKSIGTLLHACAL